MKFSDALEFKDVIIEKDLQNEIRPEVVFSCKHCSKPTGYDTLEGIQKHLDQCLFNENNKRCLMCVNLKIIENAMYPKNNHLWKSVDTEWAFGSYRTPICMKSGKELSELEIHSYHDECFELGTEMPVIEYSEEYQEWLRLSTELDEEWREDYSDVEVIEQDEEIEE